MIKEFVISKDSTESGSPDFIRKDFLRKIWYIANNQVLFGKSTFSKEIKSVSKLDKTIDNPDAEFYTITIDTSKIQNKDKYAKDTQQSLQDEYYYGLAKNKNDNTDDVLEEYGINFHDHTFFFEKPINLNNSGSVDSGGKTAKIIPTYNFLDKSIEQVTSSPSLPENALLNLYLLNFYFQNYDSKAFTSEVLTFIAENIAAYGIDVASVNLSNMFQDYKVDSIASQVLQQTVQEAMTNYSKDPKGFVDGLAKSDTNIVFGGDQVKLLSQMEGKKYIHPFGMDLVFSSQPTKQLMPMLSKANSTLPILSNILDPTPLIPGYDVYSQDENSVTLDVKNEMISYASEDTLTKVSTTGASFDSSTQVLTVEGKQNPFLQKINNVFLQKKLDSLIASSKRSYLDILNGSAAYNEVICYEIEKRDAITGEFIQKILIPNTENEQFYEYFDTQVKYEKPYLYNIFVWTAVIGNKYKYFDRTEKVMTTVWNKPEEESFYLKWLEVLLRIDETNASSFDVNDSNYGDGKAFNFSKVLSDAKNTLPTDFSDNQTITQIYAKYATIVQTIFSHFQGSDETFLSFDKFRMNDKTLEGTIVDSGMGANTIITFDLFSNILVQVGLAVKTDNLPDEGPQYSFIDIPTFTNKLKSAYTAKVTEKILNNAMDSIVDNSSYYPRFKYLDNGNKAQVQFGVLNKTDVKLFKVPYFDFNPVEIVAPPPVAPDVLPVPYKGIDNKMLFLLTNAVDHYRQIPIILEDDDKISFDKAQKIDEALGMFDEQVTFGTDEPATIFQIFRVNEQPTKFDDFKGKLMRNLYTPVGGFLDQTISPNKKYWYIFRSKDYHGMVSNPSPIFEIEIVSNSGAIYPIINTFEFATPSKGPTSKPMKRFLQLSTNQLQYLPSAEWISGVKSNNVVDANSASIYKNKFKIRLTSKNTKRSIDINLTYDKQTKDMRPSAPKLFVPFVEEPVDVTTLLSTSK